MDGRDRHNSQPVHVVDVLGRDPGDTAEQRIAEATKQQSDETIAEHFGKVVDRQNRILTELVAILRDTQSRTPEAQLRAELKAMGIKFERLEQTAYVNEATLNAVCEVREAVNRQTAAIEEQTAVLRSLFNGTGQHT